MSTWAESEEKDDLGLRLSLRSSETVCPIQLNLMPPASPPLPFLSKLAVAEKRTEMEQRPLMLRGIDVNRVPVAEWEIEDDPGGSSPNSTVSSASAGMKRGFDAAAARAAGEVVEVERECSPRGASDEEDGDGSRKKLRLSKDQSAILEESFKEHNTLNPKQKMALAKQLNLRPRQVEVWFQNRRARTKLKQTEVDCEFLKRCCENLTEENRRLQKEVQELRALKLSPQFYMHMTPPTTLTMCPSCERVAVANPSAASTAHVGTPSSASTAPPGETRLFPQPLHAAAASTPWAPIPLRHSFLDVPPQRP